MMQVDENSITYHGVNIYYSESEDSLFHISQNFRVQSHSHEVALEKCKNIDHFAKITSDTLMLSTSLTFPKEDKIRAQSVEIHIEIPEGGKVNIDGETISNHSSEDDSDEGEDSDENFYEHGKLMYNGHYYHWD